MSDVTRVVLYVATIIFGGVGVMALGQPAAMWLVLVLELVVLKLIVDVKLHLKEHQVQPR